MTATHLQQKIRSYLEEKSLSIMAFERNAGLKGNVVRNILRGQSKRPTGVTLSALARLMGCTIAELLGDDQTPVSSFQEQKDKTPPSPLFDSPEVMLSLLSYIAKANKKNTYNLTVKEVFLVLEELYDYALKKNPTTVEMDLIEWFIERIVRQAHSTLRRP